MSVTNHYKRLPCKDIIIKRTDRQRTKIDVSDLVDSIQKRGVLNPVLVTRDMTLIAGERRLTASLQLGLHDIPARFMDELSGTEAQIVELEENIRRSDLTWQDLTRAIGKLHDLFLSSDPKWSALATAKALGYEPSHIYRYLRVYKEIDSPIIQNMAGFAAAANFLSKKDERHTENSIAQILEAGQSIDNEAERPTAFNAKMQVLFGMAPDLSPPSPLVPSTMGLPLDLMAPRKPILADKEGFALPPPPPPPPSSAIVAARETILHADFLTWAPTYSGRKFNFIHCDFPYGINVFAGKQSGGAGATGTYEDQEEVFWELLRTLLAYRDRLFQNSCHIMFWFSMDYYAQIIDYFRRNAPEFTINPFPLIWHKSDNSAILPDPRRGGHRAYETAFLMYSGDRPVVKPVPNLYAAPTDKKLHPSAKPEPMLRHFFRMFVDQHTYMLDPTCGGGSSIRAAESMGASFLQGLERDKAFHEGATEALRMFRLLNRASKAAE